MTKRMVGLMCLVCAVLAALLVAGCIHADIGTMR
jgi:outer membrane murein-binding lipoprotein Lpp